MARVFPVPGGRYTNDFNARRADTGAHGGIDIFAPRGTPVRAMEDGTITKIGWNKLGGWRLWINGTWYYAHLDKYAKNIAAGSKVKAGQVVGYVGTTGNARGTPPHLHLGYDPSGSGRNWKNPYEILRGAQTGIPVSEPAGPSTGATPESEEERRKAIQASMGGVQQVPTPGGGGPAMVGYPGEAISSPPPKAPVLETWQALSLLPGASSDTKRMMELAQAAYADQD